MPRQQRSPLTLEEKTQRHRMRVQDVSALSVLLLIAIVLSFVTFGLFHSFKQHELTLEKRWRQRGEQSLATGNPQNAITSLRSALAYSPDDRDLQVELASALAAAGRTQEAIAYFLTLRESEPGSGIINLQLARLYAGLKDHQAAVDYYQTSIDGTWNGDAYLRRRAIRLELAQYLTSLGRTEDARDLLLITAGNAPENHPLQMHVAGLLLAAQAPRDAFILYRKVSQYPDVRLNALQGAGSVALTLGQFSQARELLSQAVNDAAFGKQLPDARSAVRDQLATAQAVLNLDPEATRSDAERARRVVKMAAIASERLASCTVPIAKPASTQPEAFVAPTADRPSIGARLERLNPLAKRDPSNAPQAHAATPDFTGQLQALQQRWSAVASGHDLQMQLRQDPDQTESLIQLIFDTEHTTANACGAPTGDDALILRIANSPSETQP